MTHKSEAVDLSELAYIVKNRCGVDLSRYRPTCLNRRVIHRMAMAGCEDIEEYLGILTADPGEMGKLMDVITIHVTEFFRDREVFRALERVYVPALIDEKAGSGFGALRGWSAGCSTGEEAYSMAIMFERAVSRVSGNVILEVYGTDVSEDSCRTARRGSYGGEKVEELAEDVVREYFEREGAGWKVNSKLRSIVKFGPHDLFTESPYSQLDLIMCRNVLIHFEHHVRNEIMKRFHRSLHDRGLMVLGKSEAVSGPLEELFELLDPRCKIYRKRHSNENPRED